MKETDPDTDLVNRAKATIQFKKEYPESQTPMVFWEEVTTRLEELAAEIRRNQ